MKKSKYFAIALSLLSFVGTCFMYTSLPLQIPIHFDYAWNPDGYAQKNMIFLLAGLPFLLLWLVPILLKIGPNHRSYKKNQKPYDIILLFTILLLIGMNWITISVALGMKLNGKLMIPLLLGSILICLGNYMPKVKRNFFMGVKTPWALSNDMVWRKTNRFGGYVFIITGFLFLCSAFIQQSWFDLVIAGELLIGITINFIYSYSVFRHLERSEEE